jgi:hypothetical protein
MKGSWGHFTGWTKKSQIIRKAFRNHHHHLLGKAAAEKESGLSRLPSNSKCVRQLNSSISFQSALCRPRANSHRRDCPAPLLSHEALLDVSVSSDTISWTERTELNLRDVSQALSSNTVTLDLIVSSLRFNSPTLNILWKVKTLNIHWLLVAGRGNMHAFWVLWKNNAREMQAIYEI